MGLRDEDPEDLFTDVTGMAWEVARKIPDADVAKAWIRVLRSGWPARLQQENEQAAWLLQFRYRTGLVCQGDDPRHAWDAWHEAHGWPAEARSTADRDLYYELAWAELAISRLAAGPSPWTPWSLPG